jgi:glycine dehydrogenase subunit 2
MDAATLLPAAGAHGELAGLLIMRAYFKDRGEDRSIILIPDSAHGTNPASVKMAGFTPVTVKSNSDGIITSSEIRKYLNEKVAALMVTNPNTLGVFEQEIIEINNLLHENGSLAYTDGANMNALLGISRPGDVGFDIIQLNLHKTFSAPHGGGGPGSGPVLVKEFLKDYLPVPVVVKNDSSYSLDFSVPKTCGYLKLFWGNFAVMVKAYIYIRMLGSEGLKKTAETAILNSGYLKKLIESDLCPAASKITPMHEFVLSLLPLKNRTGVRALDVAKALLDEGMHAPTMYFPLIVEEALMIEPTETESLDSLKSFATAFRRIIDTALKEPEKLKEAPTRTPSRRVDEARAARNPVLRWKKEPSE